MTISPKCNVCKAELTDYGAILLSPPDGFNNVKKDHICKKCCQEPPTNLKNP